MNKKPAFVIGATRSGGGKTTLTLGIIAALVGRGLKVQCFKCGPDFIDPTLHQTITATTSYNLDLKMMGAACCRQTYAEKGADGEVCIIEGVMGLFDGGEASTAALAKTLDVPVLLIIDSASSAESNAAVLKGFADFDPEVQLIGVVFNRIASPRHRELIEYALQDTRWDGYTGFMPRNDAFAIPERHLGLHMGGEKPLSEQSFETLAETVEASLDLDLILAHAEANGKPADESAADRAGEKLRRHQVQHSRAVRPHSRIGIARDEAFCFYYQQNFELLEKSGIELVPFSPIHDAKLPDALDMLYFGGGYPENYAAQLYDNVAMKEQILTFHRDKRPIYAECGGFMYLCRSLTDMDGGRYDMVGIFPFRTLMNKRLRRLGYRSVVLQQSCLLGTAGDLLHGHEFHYSDIEDDYGTALPAGVETVYRLDNGGEEGYSFGSAVGSYVHLHFGNTPGVCDHINLQLSGNRIDTNDKA